MTLLSHFADPLHSNGPSSRTHRPAGGAGTPAHIGAAAAQLAAIRRLLGITCAILMAGGAVAGIIALKAAIYLSHFNY